MPLCQGLPDGPCPKRRNDGSVKVGEGDLILCRDCDQARFKAFCAAQGKSVNVKLVSDKVPNSDRFQAKDDTATDMVPNSDRSHAKDDTATDTVSPSASTTVLVVSELLSYVVFHRDKVSTENLRKVLVYFYLPSEINAAKKLFVATYMSDLAECSLKTDRRKSSSRMLHDVEVEDIIGMADYLDQRSKLHQVKFVAANLDRLPKYGPEEVNICAIADNQAVLDGKVAQLHDRVEELAHVNSSTQDICQAVSLVQVSVNDTVQKALDSVQAQVSDLANVCSQLTNCSVSKHASPIVLAGRSTVKPKPDIDRSRNVIIFGVNEVDDGSWHETVLNALTTAAGRDVVIDDAFRIGKITAGHTRPIIVKLHSAWDRRTVVSGSWKLSSCDGFDRVFIRPDEPVDIRRRKSLDRLMKKATEEGRQVSLANGVLCIDNKNVFSLEHGFNRHIDGDNDA